MEGGHVSSAIFQQGHFRYARPIIEYYSGVLIILITIFLIGLH